MADGESGSLIRAFETAKVFPSPSEIEKRVGVLKAEAPELDSRELARRTVRKATARLTGVGVVAALPGAVPGFGTAVQVAVTGTTISGEAWAILRNLTAMQLTVAALYGHDIRDEARRDELVIVWGLETGAIIPAREAGKRVGAKIAVSQFNRRVSGAVLSRINRKLGTTVLTKWGTKRGGVALGRLIPFGVGTTIGGAVNYATARSFGVALMRYYDDLGPGDEEVMVVE